MMRLLKILVPILILAIGVVGFRTIKSAKPKPEPRPVEIPVPLVRVLEVQEQSYRFVIESEGTVAPRAEVQLVAEVGGRVQQVNDRFEVGGALAAGSELLAIDPRDYELEVTRARAQVTQATLALEVEEANAEVARSEWERLGEGAAGNPLVLREPQVKQAKAAVQSANAALEQAKRNLARAHVKMPWPGRVRARAVDEGQVVSPGQVLGAIYATDYVEVRVPLSSEDVGFIGVPLDHGSNGTSPVDAPPVSLVAELGGRTHRWEGTLARTEGEIDPTTRLMYAVVRVDDPNDRARHPDADSPLAVGLFVETSIAGGTIDGCFVIPRAALRGRNRVYLVEEDLLRIREVDVIRTEAERAIVRGLKSGDRLILSPLEAPVDGQTVRIAPQAAEEGSS